MPGLTYNAGDVLNVALQVSGTSPTSLSAMVWKQGTTQPAAWQVNATDSTTTLQNNGAIGLMLYLSGSTTNAPVTASFSNLWAGPLS